MSSFFIKHPVIATVIAVVTTLLGMVCLVNLPISQYPEITPRTIQLMAMFPGADAKAVLIALKIFVRRSAADARVKVTMSILDISAPSMVIRRMILSVSVAVLPEPAAALTSKVFPRSAIAVSCCGVQLMVFFSSDIFSPFVIIFVRFCK